MLGCCDRSGVVGDETPDTRSVARGDPVSAEAVVLASEPGEGEDVPAAGVAPPSLAVGSSRRASTQAPTMSSIITTTASE